MGVAQTMDEQTAFEQWLQDASPSGDCEAVYQQWLHSHARAQVLEGADAGRTDRTEIE